ncbi:hypothetical protein F4782DRAFT_216706 [Xylaria castorea]|nr:hypothetical protein F4782DRAFT_216706 [Xylaria castorea]
MWSRSNHVHLLGSVFFIAPQASIASNLHAPFPSSLEELKTTVAQFRNHFHGGKDHYCGDYDNSLGPELPDVDSSQLAAPRRIRLGGINCLLSSNAPESTSTAARALISITST